MKKIITRSMKQGWLSLELTFHPTSTRTVFGYGGLFRLKMPDIICLTERKYQKSIMTLRAYSPLSPDFDQVMVESRDIWFRCLGEVASDMLRREEVDGFEAFLQTRFKTDVRALVVATGKVEMDYEENTYGEMLVSDPVSLKYVIDRVYRRGEEYRIEEIP